MWGSFAYSHLRYMEVDLTDGRLQVLIYWPTSVTLMPLFGYTLERYWTISCSDSGHEYQINTQHLSSHHITLTLASTKQKKKKKNLRSLYSTDRGVCDEWDRPAAIKGTLGCFPDSCLILAHFSESDLGNAAIVRRAPKLPLCSPPSPPLLFSQRAKRENACATMPALLHLS